jgi:hypothetical protein
VGGQFEFRVLIQNIGAGRTQRCGTHVPSAHEGQQVRGDRLIEMPRGLCGTESGTDGECGQDTTALSILDLG